MKTQKTMPNGKSNHPEALDSDASVNEIAFAPCPDEVARHAYFTYLNQGAPLGRHVQHWLDAEAELLRERNLTRTHGFHQHS